MAEEAVVARLKAVLSGDSSQLRRDLDKANRNLESFGKKASQVGRQMSMRLTLPIVGAGVAAVKTASDFEKSMSKITALVGVAADEVASMEGAVRSMATQFGKSATEAADALFFITSAGLRGSVATDTLAASLKASAIGLGETATIADLATSALNAYGADTISASQATDVLTAAVREGKLEAGELAGSMGRVLPLSSAMGVSFNEVGAAFAALSRTGTNAAEAATQIRGILSSLLRPTKQSEEAMAGLGLSAEGLRTQIREEGLLSTLKILAERFDGNEAAAAAVFGNIRALSGVLDLMGANVATTEQIFANMADTTGTVDEAFSVMSETASFQFAQAMAEVKEVLLTIGQDIMPLVTSVVESLSGALSGFADFIKGLPDPVKNVAVALTAFAAAAGPAALAIGALSSAGAALMANPMILTGAVVFGGLATAIALGATRAAEQRERVQSLREEFQKIDSPLGGVTEGFAELAAVVAEAIPEQTISDTERLFQNLTDIAGAATIDAAIMKADLSDAFHDAGFNMRELAKQVTSGEQSFDLFSNSIDDAIDQMISQQMAAGDVTNEFDFLSDRLTSMGVTMDDNTRKLLEMVIASDLDTEAARNLANELGNVEIAMKQLRAENEAEARTLLENVDVLSDLRKIYGDNTTTVIENLVATEGYVGAVEVLNNSLQRHNDYIEMGRTRQQGLLYTQEALAQSARNAAPSIDEFARALVEAGDIAGYDIAQIASLVDGLNVLDSLSPEVRVELGLDVMGGEAILDLIDDLIKLQLESMPAISPDAGQFGFGGAIGGLMKLRDSLAAALSEPAGTGGGGGSGASSRASEAIDLVQDAANRTAEAVQRLGDSLMGYDFRDELFGADPERLVDIFADLAKQMDAFGMAGDDIERLGDKFKAAVSAADELAQATKDLNRAQDHLNDLLRDRDRLQANVTDMFSPQLSPDANVMAQTQRLLQQARTFRDNIIALRDKGFPADVIGEVVNAGLIGGAKLSSQLLRMGTGEFQQFLAMRSEIASIGESAGRIVAQITFGADIGEAEREVDDLTSALEAATEQMQNLVSNIQVDLYNTFNDFLTGLGGEITALTASPFNLNFDDSAIDRLTNLISQVTDTPAPETPNNGGGGGSGGGGSTQPTPTPAPAPSTYTVMSGDSLWQIATALLGNGTRWREIATLNGKDPNTYGTSWSIQPGQVLRIPALASGGYARKGMPHLVGEMGAELFVPDSSGYVVPNHAIGGGNQTVNVTINTHSGMRAEDIVREIEKYTRRRGQVSIPTISTRRR